MAKAKQVELKVGDKFPLCVFHDRIISQVDVEVVKVTEKAVQLKAVESATDKGVWFPRKAVVRKEGENFITKQAWFPLEGYTLTWFERNSYWGACI